MFAITNFLFIFFVSSHVKWILSEVRMKKKISFYIFSLILTG